MVSGRSRGPVVDDAAEFRIERSPDPVLHTAPVKLYSGWLPS
jgi:hypothetical protein